MGISTTACFVGMMHLGCWLNSVRKKNGSIKEGTFAELRRGGGNFSVVLVDNLTGLEA